jgi:hypothetical protein
MQKKVALMMKYPHKGRKTFGIARRVQKMTTCERTRQPKKNRYLIN